MRLAVVCPDRHLDVSLETPDLVGVGGGAAARAHLVRALSELGPASLIGSTKDGFPVDEVEADVAVLTTSGGALDLSPIAGMDLDVRARVLWIHGVSPVHGIDRFDFDLVVVPSGFIASHIREVWKLDLPIAVIPNGYWPYHSSASIGRDPHRLIYTSHPSKGLESALGVLERLRSIDERFTLDLFGGAALWGHEHEPVEAEGVTDHGLVPQPALQEAIRGSGFAIHLQQIPEAFSISVSEAMAYGAIVIASPVGALEERIEHRRTGILVPGDHRGPSTLDRAAEEILRLVRRPRRAEAIRRRARSRVLDWRAVARMWLDRLEPLIDGSG